MTIHLNNDQQAMLNGERGRAKQMAMRLLLDLAATAGATELVPIHSAHLAGVSPLTGGLGLRRFLARLAEDPEAQVAVPTTLNAAGCDASQFAAMRIVVPEFLEHSQEIVALYTRLGVRPTQSCIPYEWEEVRTQVFDKNLGSTAAWSESNAICFGNSYCGLRTNRESGLSALAAALTGYTPAYGLLEEEARRPNLEVLVTAHLDDPTDFSILGDWIGRQRRPHWRQPYGPIPFVRGLTKDEGRRTADHRPPTTDVRSSDFSRSEAAEAATTNLTHEQRKALAAAAANYGCALLYIEGEGEEPPAPAFQDTLTFTQADLEQRYAELRPHTPASLIVIGCPQASVGELRAAAELLRGKRVSAAPDDGSGRPPLWIFTSSANKAIAARTGLAAVIRESGALLLENTCPEVVPYDQGWVKRILTNSMKAEHYLRSGLNGIPTSVMRLADCVAVATQVAGGRWQVARTESEMLLLSHPLPNPPPTRERELPSPSEGEGLGERVSSYSKIQNLTDFRPPFAARGRGLPSQGDFTVRGEAFVTDAPITFLGFVNRETGVIEEPGHPADGQSMAGKIAIFPRGIGSTVAPYVLLELYYRGVAPLAIINSQMDQQSAPACSLEGIPYAYGFDADIIHNINPGDMVELRRQGETVTLGSTDFDGT